MQLGLGVQLPGVQLPGVQFALNPSDGEDENLMGRDDERASSEVGADIIWAAAIIDYSLPPSPDIHAPTTTILHC